MRAGGIALGEVGDGGPGDGVAQDAMKAAGANDRVEEVRSASLELLEVRHLRVCRRGS
jgi:hypothetical protein